MSVAAGEMTSTGPVRLLTDDPEDLERRMAAGLRALEALGCTLAPIERELIARVDAREKARA